MAWTDAARAAAAEARRRHDRSFSPTAKRAATKAHGRLLQVSVPKKASVALRRELAKRAFSYKFG